MKATIPTAPTANASISIGDININYDGEKILLKDGGVFIENKISKRKPEDIAKDCILSMWYLYYRYHKASDRANGFERGTGLSPIQVRRYLTKRAPARISGEVVWSKKNGVATIIVAPGCSRGSRFSVIENREYNVTSVYRRLVKFFRSAGQ